MAANQENQYELAIENFSFMTFHPCAISIFCNHTKADTSLQCMLKCSNFCKWWKGRNYVEYISLSMSNMYHQYREILPVGFNKLLDCSLKQSFFPPSATAGSQDNILVTFYHKSVWAISVSMELCFSLPPSANFTHFILLLKISW